MVIEHIKVGGEHLYKFIEELNYKLTDKEYSNRIQELFNRISENVIFKKTGDEYCLEVEFTKVLIKEIVSINIVFYFDKTLLKSVELTCIPNTDDETNYDSALKLYYYEEIKGVLFDLVNREKKKYTLRIYKIIYNTTSIKGCYTIKFSHKIVFHSLFEIDKNEPLTEHVICFDIDVEAQTFDDARSIAYNTVTEFCDYLSVLLDIEICDPNSKFCLFIEKNNGDYVLKRFRTGFYDDELKLFVKDNFNGLCPKTEVEKSNFLNGYYSASTNDGNTVIQMKTGDVTSLEKVFASHKLYKVEKNNNDGVYGEDISSKLHFGNMDIYIPKKIREYYRSIVYNKEKHYSKYQAFRNACRLYNLGKNEGMKSASIEISFLVASIEALAKYRGISFSDFIAEYNPNVSKTELDNMYTIRSKLFHSGEFSFFEYSADLNPYNDPLYNEFQKKYITYRKIIRETFINWIIQEMTIISNEKENNGR